MKYDIRVHDKRNYKTRIGADVMQAGGWRTSRMVARYSEHQTARRGAMAKLAAIQNRL